MILVNRNMNNEHSTETLLSLISVCVTKVLYYVMRTWVKKHTNTDPCYKKNLSPSIGRCDFVYVSMCMKMITFTEIINK